ncbi:hypothetical protein AB8Z38_19930 [Bradyrhizobium sp. LLZ17]|uniref:Uncharacterized protein n=1 Tax=Bradyrhizobium sp. LLZ17 TaxID=3239388 RepID=A0AB39XDA4_9BRAD
MLDFSAVRAYLEAGYFLAGILVTFGLFLAYRQLSLLRLDINLRNERAAKEKAITACERYLKSYVRKAGALYDARKNSNLPEYDGLIGNFTRASIPTIFLASATQKLLLETALPALNELESIAASFRTGVADEWTGFEIIGRTFCSTVEHHYDLIACCREKQPHSYWSGIVGLYGIWSPRLTKAEMKFERDHLDQRISSLKDSGITPVGVNRV